MRFLLNIYIALYLKKCSPPTTLERFADAEGTIINEPAAKKPGQRGKGKTKAKTDAKRMAAYRSKKKAKQDAQERKARRLSAAAWAERPALAVWPSEEDLLLSTAVPLPATPVQQRYEGRLSRARNTAEDSDDDRRDKQKHVRKEE